MLDRQNAGTRHRLVTLGGLPHSESCRGDGLPQPAATFDWASAAAPVLQRALLVLVALVGIGKLLREPEGEDDAPDDEQDVMDLQGMLQNDWQG
jgi:hypothetical protein